MTRNYKSFNGSVGNVGLCDLEVAKIMAKILCHLICHLDIEMKCCILNVLKTKNA